MCIRDSCIYWKLGRPECNPSKVTIYWLHRLSQKTDWTKTVATHSLNSSRLKRKLQFTSHGISAKARELYQWQYGRPIWWLLTGSKFKDKALRNRWLTKTIVTNILFLRNGLISSSLSKVHKFESLKAFYHYSTGNSKNSKKNLT